MAFKVFNFDLKSTLKLKFSTPTLIYNGKIYLIQNEKMTDEKCLLKLSRVSCQKKNDFSYLKYKHRHCNLVTFQISIFRL